VRHILYLREEAFEKAFIDIIRSIHDERSTRAIILYFESYDKAVVRDGKKMDQDLKKVTPVFLEGISKFIYSENLFLNLARNIYQSKASISISSTSNGRINLRIYSSLADPPSNTNPSTSFNLTSHPPKQD
jgi:hypothetical protein